MQAQVVRAALEQRDANRAAERLRDGRQVAVEKLVLESARAGRDDHLPSGEQRRHEVCESLARSRARFDREHSARGQRLAHPVRHELLLAARLEVVDHARERPRRAEQAAEFSGAAHGPRARAMYASTCFASTGSVTPPCPSTASWNARTSNRSPSSRAARLRSALISSSPVLYASAWPGQAM